MVELHYHFQPHPINQKIGDMMAEVGGEPRYTVDQALVAVGFGKFQCLVLLYAGMGWIAEAMEMMLLSFVGPSVKSQWHLNSRQESLISSVVFAGMLVGAYSWGVVSDRFGRRRGFLATAITTSGAGVLSALAPNYVALLICRCLVGVGVGGGPVLFSWFLEFVPAPNRGTWMVLFSAFWTVGAIFEAGLAWIIMPRLAWRWLLGLSAVPTFFLLLLYVWTPESPRYLCLHGKKAQAIKVLDQLAKLNGKQLPPGTVVSDHELNTLPPSSAANGAPLVPMGKVSAETETENARPPPSLNSNHVNAGIVKSLLLLLSPKLARSTLLLWVVFFGNAFSYYGLVLLTTQLNSRDNKCHASPSKKSTTDINYKEVFVTTFAEFPGYVLSAIIVDRLGRKISISGMMFACCIFLVPLVVHQTGRVTTGLLFGARTFISASFNTVYIYAPEIYPTSVRTTGIGVASSMGRIGGMICPVVAVGLVQGCQQAASIALFVGVIVFAAIAAVFFPLETKGRELSDTISSTKINNQIP
ncbi:hypothetical protein K2173_016379 [Erythroxylum novogranatense]|uniref:Major facilitator superfamily (MFS) profile domain-containing protein n=1 Tax=Erythroxylum novogranatense TaxID=1862640 RepID=A0AAV8SGA9_9ROSI|nr:hypothetical protein K2173_016379 [Erythroxylum novogranatense]